MAADDWFRNQSWSPEIEEAFFAKLARARSQRDQYLVIQAGTLVSSHPDVALKLVDLYFETRTNEFHDVLAFLHKADAYLTLGRLDDAVPTYKRVLEREAEFPNHRTTTYVNLPYLIATRRISTEYQYASELLERDLDVVSFPIDRFKHAAAKALILGDTGDSTGAASWASAALEAASAEKSGFRYHQDVGLVGPEYELMIRRLKKLAA